jgi:Rad3-related DNA helicase
VTIVGEIKTQKNQLMEINMNSILDFVPGKVTLWPNQITTLMEVEKYWDMNQVVVIISPVGSGKSIVGQTIARWRKRKDESTATILHRVALQDQYADNFKDVALLKGKSRYSCSSGGTCHDNYEETDSYCESCPYKISIDRATEEANAIFNYQSYSLRNITKTNIILDEGHTASDIIAEMFSLSLWQGIHDYPNKMSTHGDVALWLEKEIVRIGKDIVELADYVEKNPKEELSKELSALRQTINLYRRVLDGLQRAPTDFFIEHVEGTFRNKPSKGLRVRPVNLAALPPIMWPHETKKIVIMSATFSEKDMSILGLMDRKYKFIECDSPIPHSQRKVIVDNPHNMSYKYQEKNIPKLAKQLLGIFDEYPDVKGFVHLPYSMAEKIREDLLVNPRVIWHDKDNKEDVLKAFKASKEPLIMLASGFAEGVDLKGKEFGFQVITKVMFPSMADKLNEMLYREDSERMSWQTVRTILQQAGRICRGPDDEGVTIITDGSFGNKLKKRRGLYQRANKYFPKYFKDSLEWR